ncbi:MAG: VOC family protein [Burkholderiales bacterium]|nr:VOC family protein [Burkholderiales bacterium]
MDPRMSFLTLGVKNLDRARDFYSKVLGWPLSSKSNAHVAFFQLNGFVLGLYPREALAADAGVAAEGSGFSGVALAHNVATRDDVDALLAQLAAQGVRIVKPASDAFWGGRTGYFADLDGYLWEVAWNPGGYLDDAGNFIFDK